MNRLVVISGPPRSGKSTAAEEYRRRGFVPVSIGRLIKEHVHALYGLRNLAGTLPWDRFEDAKDEPRDEFRGASPRAAYVAVATALRDLHGTDVWGRMAAEVAHALLETSSDVVLCDAGNSEEARAFIEAASEREVTHVRLTRAGCEYDDGREPVRFSHVETHWVINSGSIEDLLAQLP